MTIAELRALATKLHSLYDEHEEACEINDGTSGGDLRECRLAEGCYRASVVLPALLDRLEAAEAERDKWKQQAIDDCESLQAERAERDALRECVRAADAMYSFADHTGGNPGCNRCDAADNFLAARAKVGK